MRRAPPRIGPRPTAFAPNLRRSMSRSWTDPPARPGEFGSRPDADAATAGPEGRTLRDPRRHEPRAKAHRHEAAAAQGSVRLARRASRGDPGAGRGDLGGDLRHRSLVA